MNCLPCSCYMGNDNAVALAPVFSMVAIVSLLIRCPICPQRSSQILKLASSSSLLNLLRKSHHLLTFFFTIHQRNVTSNVLQRPPICWAMEKSLCLMWLISPVDLTKHFCCVEKTSHYDTTVATLRALFSLQKHCNGDFIFFLFWGYSIKRCQCLRSQWYLLRQPSSH